VAERVIGFREVLGAAAVSVVIVLGAAVATSLLPPEGQTIVFRTPLLIVVLLVGTAAALWRISRPRPPDG
jgi:FtsH-binding integral membrane protein